MPTTPKLLAAIFFALLAWFCAELAKNHLVEGTRVNQMSYVAAAVGFLSGWIFLGKRAGDTMQAALAYGFSTSVILSFWCVFYFAFETMIKRSLDKRYKGPTEALLGMVDLMKEYALYVVKPDVALMLVVGGLLGGWIVEKSARRWS